MADGAIAHVGIPHLGPCAAAVDCAGNIHPPGKGTGITWSGVQWV
jgi:hypothetical protein